ncbi:MAG TPA: SDR family oxidoreductase [Gemmatimonadaceae bacterium]|nr:SDR family oxidoreductase [Gemmatimonadaceae bacterium]
MGITDEAVRAVRKPLTAPDGRRLLLVTGVSGYVGGRLVLALHDRGERIRCMARRPEELRAHLAPGIEVAGGDVLDPGSLAHALEGVDTAYYLVHAMGSRRGFEEEESKGALNFASAARAAGVRRLVYLGGLGHEGELSRHLASRQEVGRLLRDSGVPTIEFRASVIIGSGSLSFELVRALVERLPVLITPRWVAQRTQPIAIEDVIAYLVAAPTLPIAYDGEGTVVEIGGADQVSYQDLMREYAAQRGLRRLFIPVPVLTPWLSSRWLGLVTPVYANVGRKLIDGLRNETVVTTPLAAELFPEIRPRGMRDAVRRALASEDREFAETRWSDALSSASGGQPWGGARAGSRLVDSRESVVPVAPSAAFRPIECIGGTTGWYDGDWLWRLRGWVDLVAGGAGMRRGRRHPTRLRPGDAVDFWRVDALERDRMLRLRAEMRLPGRAWLQFEVEGDDTASVIRQTAIFEPRGVLGLLYWYALFPVHALIFRGMLRGIAKAAARLGSGAPAAR